MCPLRESATWPDTYNTYLHVEVPTVYKFYHLFPHFFKGLSLVTVITHGCDVPDEELRELESICGSPEGHTFIVDNLASGKHISFTVSYVSVF